MSEKLMNPDSEKLSPLKRGKPTRKQRKVIKSILEEYYRTRMILLPMYLKQRDSIERL